MSACNDYEDAYLKQVQDIAEERRKAGCILQEDSGFAISFGSVPNGWLFIAIPTTIQAMRCCAPLNVDGNAWVPMVYLRGSKLRNIAVERDVVRFMRDVIAELVAGRIDSEILRDERLVAGPSIFI